MTGTVEGDSVTRTMTYTPGGMMETYSDGERVQRNTYIGGETRVRKEEGTSLQNLTDITNYFYQEGSVLYTTDGESNPKSFNLLNISDIFGTERTDVSDEYYYFYLDDIRGSKTGLIDSTARSIVSYWYNDFGEVSEERAEVYEDFINEVQYTGAIYDVSTGLLYLNARFYDPSTGRFISQDSYRGERDEPDTWHLYAYCANDPVNYVDPSGHLKQYFLNRVDVVGGLIDAALLLVGIVSYGKSFKAIIQLFKKYKSTIGKRMIRSLENRLRIKITKTLANAALDLAQRLFDISIGRMIARGIDYVEGWYGYTRSNGYIFN